MLNRESKIFFIVLFFIILSTIIFLYHDTLVLRRFDIFISEDEIPSYQSLSDEALELIGDYVR